MVCFTGDGAFYYHLGEMETAPALRHQHHHRDQQQRLLRPMRGRGQRPPTAAARAIPGRFYCFEPVDFTAVANDMGCLGIKVERPQDIAPALAQAQAADRPVLVEVITDPACSAPDPWTPPPAGA